MRVIELSRVDYERAEDAAAKRDRTDLTQLHGAALSDATNSREIHILGAQAEIAVAIALGTHAPLASNVFLKQPNIPPCWSVKAIFEHSRNQDLRLRPRDWHPGWRHVLVERAALISGGWVFAIHGWITDEDARAAGRMGFGDRMNRFISPRYLRELEYEGPSGEHLEWLQRVAERNRDVGGGSVQAI